MHCIAVGARVSVGAVALMLGGAACYNYRPTMSSDLQVEHRAEFMLTDEGRVAMARTLGPGIRSIDGRLIAVSDSMWTVKVFRIESFADGPATWGGEVVQMPRSAVGMVALREFDPARSTAAAVVITGAVLLFVVRGPFGGGWLGDPFTPGGPSTGHSLRVP